MTVETASGCVIHGCLDGHEGSEQNQQQNEIAFMTYGPLSGFSRQQHGSIDK